MKRATFKFGIWQNGANVKAICECDVLETAVNVPEAVYVETMGIVRNPENPFTPEAIEKIKSNMIINMQNLRFTYKAMNRQEADALIKSVTPGQDWDIVVPFETVTK